MTHTFKELTQFFQLSLHTLATKLKYSEDNILILQGKEEELKNKYPDTYRNILSCSHNRDSRTPMEYAKDLVASWLFEDYIVEKFRVLGYSLYLSGKDKERKILNNTKVGADCDLIFLHDNEKYNVELISDYTNYWKRSGSIDLRDSKFPKLLSSNGILLAVSFKDKKYSLIPVTNSLPVKYISSHKYYGGKPVYQIQINYDVFKEFKVVNIIENLIDIIKK